jgi:hypothetical protein
MGSSFWYPVAMLMVYWYTVLRIRLGSRSPHLDGGKTLSDQHLTSSGPGQVQQLAAYLSKDQRFLAAQILNVRVHLLDNALYTLIYIYYIMCVCMRLSASTKLL